jgi:hypothetical protein
MRLTIPFHQVLRLTKSRAIPLFPYKPSCCVQYQLYITDLQELGTWKKINCWSQKSIKVPSVLGANVSCFAGSDSLHITKDSIYSRTTSRKFLSYCTDSLHFKSEKPYSPPASVAWCMCCICKWILTPPPLWLQNRTHLNALSWLDISLQWLVLILPEAGGIVGLILLYKYLYNCGYFDVHSLN